MREIKRSLLVRPDCLMFFCDETGHEDFRDPKFPLFGIGGCAIFAGAFERVLKNPWRSLKAKHFGSPDVPLHASDLKDPGRPQIEALARFFREQEFFRFAVAITPRCKLPKGITAYHTVSRELLKCWEELTPRIRPMPTEVAFIFEASERSDVLVQRSGEWNDDDYDALVDGVMVGRIMKAAAVPPGMSLMWTLAFGHHEDRTPTHGYEPTREAAMAAFA
jgi:Protein of unknown function (DUF3800)